MTLKRICIRFLNMIMTICLIASMLPVFSFSDGFRSSETATTKDSTCIKETAADGSITGLKYVDEKAIEKQGAIKRLTEKESLNSYVFKNKDGTESVFLFSENIKYVNDSGETVEKDISIEKSKSNGFSVKSSDYKAVFPVDIKDGLIFEYRKGSIILAPQNASSEIKVIDNTALYQDVFGKGTMLKYTPQLSGIKEDIVLNHYTGCSSFSFDLEIKNLTLLQKDGSVLFINDSDEPVISFGEVYTYDSAGNLSKGNLYITKEDDPEKYSLKISVSDDFLKDPKTVYPVTIDPTINEYSDGSAIQDAPVFSGQNSQNTNYGGYIYNSIGITSMGTARTAVRLYGLEINPIYRTLDAEEIVSVKLCVRETTGNASKYVNLYRITDDVSWTESTVTYNNAGAFDSSDNKGAMLNSGSWTEFDITSFAKGWQNLSYAKTMRVIFTMSGGENSSLKQIDSSECAQESKRPYIVFTYQVKNLIDDGTYFIRNKHIDKYLQPTNGSSSADTGMELRSFSGSDAQKWIVTSNGNGYYTIKSAQSNYVLSVPSGSYSTYDVQLIQTANSGDDGQLWRIYMTSYCGFAIKPKSACGSSDGVGWSDRTMSVADGNNGDGAVVTQRPYVYNNSFKDEWYLVPTFLSENVSYEIENRQAELYLRPEGGYPFINNSLELWSHSDNETQKWKFTVLGNGYCKISPYYDTTLAITVNEGSELSENGSVSLKAYSEGNYRQQWLIYKVPQGFAFKARSSDINNLVLSVSGNNPSNGSVASQKKYNNELYSKEVWCLKGNYRMTSSVDLFKNQTSLLTVPGIDPVAILWTSDNPGIAVVNEYGTISGLCIGKTEISALFEDPADSSVVELTCNVNVIIEDGVYSIKNNNSNKFLDTGMVSIVESCRLYQYQTRYGESVIRQLWRITYVSEGNYRISPYYYDGVYVGTDNEKVVLTHDLNANTLWQLDTKDDCLAVKNSVTGKYIKIEADSTGNNASVINENGCYSASNGWVFEKKNTAPSGILFFDCYGISWNHPVFDDVLPGESKSLESLGLTVSVYTLSNTAFPVDWSSDSNEFITVNCNGLVHVTKTGTYTITAHVRIDNSDYIKSYTLKVGYRFGITVQNAYPSSCEMGSYNYASFGLYASNLENGLLAKHSRSFYYQGVDSDVNDLKNKNLPGATHTYTNMDDVDLMIFVGHGYAKNRNEQEGLFLYNSLHFGLNSGQASHIAGIGNVPEANYTTLDALNFGSGTRTKWLVTYTCNFLNTAQGDPNVNNILSNGGRLVLGLGSKEYIVAQEGTDFADYLNKGETIASAFFKAGHDNQDERYRLSKKLYRVLYYGPEEGGTLNDTLLYPLGEYENQQTRIKEAIVNPEGTAFQLY